MRRAMASSKWESYITQTDDHFLVPCAADPPPLAHTAPGEPPC